MKLHSNKMGTNPRRVGVYLAEKGLQIELIEVDTTAREHKRPEFLAYPRYVIPVLELDDGGALPESAVIVEYLEELNPEPPMIGVTRLWSAPRCARWNGLPRNWSSAPV